MISCFLLVGEPLSQPWLSVCWGTAGSPNAISTQCVWASPLATLAWTRVGWRGYPNLSLLLSASSLHLSFFHMYTLSIFLSLYLPHISLCYLSSSLQIVFYLSHLFMVYITMLHSPSAIFFSFSTFCRDKPQWKRNTALQTWQSKRYLSSPCRARWRGLQILYLLGKTYLSGEELSAGFVCVCKIKSPSSEALNKNKNYLWHVCTHNIIVVQCLH